MLVCIEYLINEYMSKKYTMRNKMIQRWEDVRTYLKQKPPSLGWGSCIENAGY